MQRPDRCEKAVQAQATVRKTKSPETEFSTEHPTQIWVSDITYFKVKNYWVYLCIILDIYSRKVIGWRVSKHMSTHLVTATFKATYQGRGRPQNLIFHSDWGSQYVSKTLTKIF